MLKKIWETLWKVAKALFGRTQRTNLAESLFLPRGQGPGILILGGITMLAISLLLSLRIPRKGPASAGPAASQKGDDEPGKGPGRFTVVHDDASPPPAVRSAMDIAREEGLGEPRHVKADPDRHGLAFERCPGKGFSGSRTPGCEAAKQALEKGVRSEGRGRVVTISCNRLQPRACMFEIVPERDEFEVVRREDER